MSVDIKSLRIGSHIKCGGDIHQIVELNMIDAPIPLMRGVLCDKDFSVFSYPKTLNNDLIEPIKITPDLLAGLGFKRDGDRCNYILNKADCEQSIRITHVQDIGSLLIINDVDEHGEIEFMRAFVTYLHELESLYYHVFKKELIEE